jgi:hypothetical protein
MGPYSREQAEVDGGGVNVEYSMGESVPAHLEPRGYVRIHSQRRQVGHMCLAPTLE